MISIASTFEGTPIVPAHSGGAYVVDAGTSLTLSATNTHPSASYEWDLGDGTTATGPSVSHTFSENGIYVAKLELTVNEPGGARSRHFARIEVRNVPPSVDAGGDRTVDEGEAVSFTATFSDPEWPDTHEAVWNWGDYQSPTVGEVSEVNEPPSGGGTVEGSHAWGDDGVYEVTLTVRDDDGGIGEDTVEVTVLNVPPKVDAGPDLYAYPCTVITLVGTFTDPGWLDTHVATWEFGDCTPPHPALIEETNKPPADEGSAVASHVYHRCGTYQATCRVVDDDGGVGEDTTVIRVVDVANADFEDGFRARAVGAVANSWEPYLAAAGPEEKASAAKPAEGKAVEVFLAEELLVHGGQRSQRIRTRAEGRAGILQRVGANPGWDYQVSGWYSLAERSGGSARLGLDPAGGTHPDAPGVVWSEGFERRQWAQLVARVCAEATAITIFLEADPGGKEVDACLDDVALVPIQPFCPQAPPPQKPEEPEEPQERCVDFADLGPRAELPPTFEREGFGFSSLDGGDQWIVPWGDPEGIGKLDVRGGVEVRLPFAAEWVRVRMAQGGGQPVVVVALDAEGSAVGKADQAPHEIEAPGMTTLIVKGGSGESWMVSVCARPGGDQQPPAEPEQPPKPVKTHLMTHRREARG